MIKTMIEVPMAVYDTSAMMLFDLEELVAVEPYCFGGKVDESYVRIKLRTNKMEYVLAMSFAEFKKVLSRASSVSQTADERAEYVMNYISEENK